MQRGTRSFSSNSCKVATFKKFHFRERVACENVSRMEQFRRAGSSQQPWKWANGQSLGQCCIVNDLHVRLCMNQGVTHRAALWIFIPAVYATDFLAAHVRNSSTRICQETSGPDSRIDSVARLRRLSHAEVELILSPFRFNLRDPMFAIPAENSPCTGDVSSWLTKMQK